MGAGRGGRGGGGGDGGVLCLGVEGQMGGRAVPVQGVPLYRAPSYAVHSASASRSRRVSILNPSMMVSGAQRAPLTIIDGFKMRNAAHVLHLRSGLRQP